MSDFDERSGVVGCATPWGEWQQTIEEVFVIVNAEKGIRGKDISVTIKPRVLKVTVRGETIIEGQLFSSVLVDESTWTLEDQCQVRILLTKCDRTAKNGWRSLLVGQYEADPFIFDQMEQKLALQRMQFENPGMDFSGASISGNYQGGGPDLGS